MRNTCSDENCDLPVFGRGLCSRHYQAARYHGTLPEDPPERICLQCGDKFQARKWNAQYCSRKCNDLARYNRTRRSERLNERCVNCDVNLTGKRTDARFCSPRCSDEWRNHQRQAVLNAAKVAARQPCLGCGGSIPSERKSGALYCSEECKVRSRRHQAYGLTKDELDALLDQHGVCAICCQDAWGSRGPQVDHDHTTGRVRGVLCTNCNNGLGRFGDDPARLRAAIEYLER